jgi:hypothetical protein
LEYAAGDALDSTNRETLVKKGIREAMQATQKFFASTASIPATGD